jgi:hypothetical protein
MLSSLKRALLILNCLNAAAGDQARGEGSKRCPTEFAVRRELVHCARFHNIQSGFCQEKIAKIFMPSLH